MAYDLQQLLRGLSKTAFGKHMAALQHVLSQTVRAQTVQDLLKQVRADKNKEERALLLEQIRSLFRNPDGTYRGYMCRECKFGPVDHYACSSLTGSDRNRCLLCGWSATHLSAWLPWDGNIPEAAFAAPNNTERPTTAPRPRARSPAPATGAHVPHTLEQRRPVTASPSAPAMLPLPSPRVRAPTTRHQVARVPAIHALHPHRSVHVALASA